MNENDNLEKQYDQIVSYISEINKLIFTTIQNIYRRKLFTLSGIIMSFKIIIVYFRKFNPLSGKNPEIIMEILDNANENERKNPIYHIITSEYPMNELTCDIEKKYPDIDYNKILKIHEYKKEQISDYSPRRFYGAILTIFTILLSSLPKNIVSKIIKNEIYETAVIIITAITIVYCTIILLPFWIMYNRARKKHARVGNVIWP